MERKGKLVSKKYREYFLATLFMSGSISIASVVDKIMIGNILGSVELAAANATNSVISALNIIFAFFIYGGNTLAAMYRGKCDKEKSNKSFTISIIGGVVAMGIFGIIAFLCRSPIAHALIKNKEDLYPYVYDYLFPHFFLGIFMILINGISAYIRVDGLKNLSIAIPIVANGVNLCFDYIYMKILHMGIIGAGWATITGYAVAVVMLIPYFRSKKRNVHFTKIGIEDIRLTGNILNTGLPTALMHLCIFIKSFFMNRIILEATGTIGMQTAAVCLSAYSVANIFFTGTSLTLLPISGALYGEQDYKGIKYLLKTSLSITEVICVCIVILFECFPTQIGMIHGVKSEETMAMLKTAFRLFSICVPISGALFTMRSYYQSTGSKNVSAVMTMVDGVVIFIPTILFLSKVNANFLWLAFSISPLLTLIIFGIALQILGKKSGKTDFLLLPPERQAKVFEFSIDNTLEQAVRVSEKVMHLCLDNGISENIATITGLSAEELCTNTAKFAYGEKSEQIDIFLKIYDDKIILRIRDNGKIFNPTDYKDESGKSVSGLSVLNSLPAKVVYNRVVGFNTTIVTINR